MDEDRRTHWTKVVAEFEQSGQTQREFAEQRQIELSRLRYWIYTLRHASRPLVTGREDLSVKSPERRAPTEAARMLPVRVVASTAPKARPGTGGALLLELELPSGMCLRFPSGTDLGYLRQLAAAF
jgi:hypothetical protein